MRVEFLTPANQEFLAAIDYYQARAPGLGEDFILDVEASLELITEADGLDSGGIEFRVILFHRRPNVAFLQGRVFGTRFDEGFQELAALMLVQETLSYRLL